MPTYEYECQKCGHIFEAFQLMTAKPLRKCPECGGKVKRLLGTGAGIIFKGSGFYETDYKKSNVSSQSSAEKTDKSKPAKDDNSAKSAKKDKS